MFNHESFARVFDDSGLTKTEIADIYGVSRQTVYAWYSGSSAPLQRTVVAREQLYTRALLTACHSRRSQFASALLPPGGFGRSPIIVTAARYRSASPKARTHTPSRSASSAPPPPSPWDETYTTHTPCYPASKHPSAG